MKIIFVFYLFLSCFFLNEVHAQVAGCLVTDGGNKRLYTLQKTSSPTVYTANCGGVSQSNLRGYEGSPVAIGANCSWTPGVIDVLPHTCYVPIGGYCGKVGAYVLACPLDFYALITVFLAALFGFFFLKTRIDIFSFKKFITN